jgi:hypothetical protein
MPIKIHIVKTQAEADAAIRIWGVANLKDTGPQPSLDCQVFETDDVTTPKLDYTGKSRWVLVFEV